MDGHWYALRSKRHKEDVLQKYLAQEGYNTFLPQLRVQPVNPRAKRNKPYFPCYLFVEADMLCVGESYFRWMPNSLGLVTYGTEPAVVERSLISRLRDHLEQLNAQGIQNKPRFSKGEQVLIHAGPFEGFEAIFDSQLAGGERVKVLLKMLSGSYVRMDLPVSQLS